MILFINYSNVRKFLKKNKDKFKDDVLVQRVIDPETDKDITGQYIHDRLKELDIIGDDIIKNARIMYEMEPEKKKEIYEKAYWEIHENLGMGSIGPATAAAGPIMMEKKDKLAIILEISDEELI